MEEEFTNYIKVCAYDYQKVAFLELYKIIVDDLYNEVKEKAQQGIFANKTYRDIKLSFFLPAYIVFDNAVEMKIIRIDK
ncbi:hypothetical protein DW974_09860 [Lachnospiraceae bacterium AM48-27BH]|nr:hypothetical protein DW974_09860 [Lachnospiraceae bacterium AM48-27BH]